MIMPTQYVKVHSAGLTPFSWYDPSYGTIIPGTTDPQRLTAVDASMEGFAVGVNATVLLNGQKVNRYLILIRKPISAQTDLGLNRDPNVIG